MNFIVVFADKMEESIRDDILDKLRQRNNRESRPFIALFQIQDKISEQNLQLKSDNSSLCVINEKLKEENVILKSKVSAEPSIHSNENFLELQRKLFSLQEELTELHR